MPAGCAPSRMATPFRVAGRPKSVQIVHKENPLGECRFNSKNIGRRMCLRAENRGKDKGHSTLIDPLCFVEAGDYPIGGENHTAFVQQFLIGKTPVTNRQYLDYLEATHHSDPLRSDLGLSEILGNLPAVDLSWHEAKAYCNWFGETHGVTCGMPTAIEWEAAARGKQGLLFPWGTTFEPGHCLSLDECSPGPVPVGSFENGATSPDSGRERHSGRRF